MGDIDDFQADLRCGMTLEKALKKHNFTLKEALHLCTKPKTVKKKPKRKYDTSNPYIQKRGKYYYLRKNIKGKTVMFGTYRTLEDAETVRNYMIRNGWNQKRVGYICGRKGIKRVKSKNERRYYK